MNSAQQEQLLAIGSYLKQVRQEQGKTIEEAANQIFIRSALVRAIEEGDWESLPEPIFVKGFIRRYAEFLGLNGVEVAKSFELTPVLPLNDSPTTDFPTDVSSTQTPSSVAASAPPLTQELSQPEVWVSRERSRAPSAANWPWLWGLLALLPLLGVGIWLATRGGSDRPAVTQSAPPPETPETASPEPTPPPEPAPSEPTPPKPSAPITFTVNLEEDSWMRVLIDGEVAYEGTLTAGTQQSWTAQRELRITAGNSGAVKYSFNGSPEKPLGEPGAVTSLTLTPETNLETEATAVPTPPSQ